jgi:butyrate kinase
MKNLILNPGSTSTKVAVYDAGAAGGKIFTKTISHPQEELGKFPGIMDQKQYRSEAVLNSCKEEGVALTEIAGVIGIGGLLYSGVGGVYEVNDKMLRDLMAFTYGEHAANLGGVIASEVAAQLNIKAYIADPITTDEMHEIARLSGMPDVVRSGKTHALNQKAVAKRAAKELGIPRESANLVVIHLGGGISVAAHRGGLIIDTNDPRGEGPFCMDRIGGVHALEIAKLCFSGKYTKEEMLKKISGNGGVVAYLNTRDFRDVVRMRDEKDPTAIAVYDALAYQIAKEIGAEVAVLRGKVDAIVFTGGMAHNEGFINEIKGYIGHFAKVLVFPGEFELDALAEYISLVQSGEIKPLVYTGKPD